MHVLLFTYYIGLPLEIAGMDWIYGDALGGHWNCRKVLLKYYAMSCSPVSGRGREGLRVEGMFIIFPI